MVQPAAFRVLACFYDQEVLTFTQLCKMADYPTDLGGYYIRQLVTGKYIEKIERGAYQILPLGKREFAVRFHKNMTTPRPRLLSLVVPRMGDKYIVLRRTVQPFVGSAEWPARSVMPGESLADAARRTIADRLGVNGEPILHGFFRRVDIYKDTLFDDKLFAVHAFQLTSAQELHNTSRVGAILTCTTEALHRLEKPSKQLFDIYNFVASKNTAYSEHTYNISRSDLSPPT